MKFTDAFTYGTNASPRDDKHDGEELSLKTKVGYAAGHVFNDMVSVIEPGYTLLFLKYVIHLNSINSGLIVLIGQFCNGLSTALIGLLIDLDYDCRIYNHYGRQKTWHLIGTICVIISFPFLCLTPIGLDITSCASRSFKINVLNSQDEKISSPNISSECVFEESQYEVILYYAIVVILENFGWAAVQTSHLSMIPYLTISDRHQLTLNSIRNSATSVSYIFVYCIAWKLFDARDKVGEQSTDELQGVFQNIMLIIVSLGAFSSCLFHLLVKEKHRPLNTTYDTKNFVRQSSMCRSSRLSRPFNKVALPPPDKQPDTLHEMKISQWLLEPQFYLTALHYMMVRLFFQASSIYAPFFVSKTLKLPNEYMATVPLVMYAGGLLFSVATKYLPDILGLKKSMVFCSLFGLGGCLWILFGCNDRTYYIHEVLGIAITIGGASSAMIILSLTMIAAYIGSNIGKKQVR